MKRFPWAVAGVLVALTALPTLASATGDNSADSPRTRGTDLLRRVAPVLPPPVVVSAAEPDPIRRNAGASRLVLPPQVEPVPMPVAAAEILSPSLDLQIELVPSVDIAGIVFRDQPVIVGRHSNETLTRIRQEMDALVYFDLPVEQD